MSSGEVVYPSDERLGYFASRAETLRKLRETAAAAKEASDAASESGRVDVKALLWAGVFDYHAQQLEEDLMVEVAESLDALAECPKEVPPIIELAPPKYPSLDSYPINEYSRIMSEIHPNKLRENQNIIVQTTDIESKYISESNLIRSNYN